MKNPESWHYPERILYYPLGSWQTVIKNPTLISKLFVTKRLKSLRKAKACSTNQKALRQHIQATLSHNWVKWAARRNVWVRHRVSLPSVLKLHKQDGDQNGACVAVLRLNQRSQDHVTTYLGADWCDWNKTSKSNFVIREWELHYSIIYNLAPKLVLGKFQGTRRKICPVEINFNRRVRGLQDTTPRHPRVPWKYAQLGTAATIFLTSVFFCPLLRVANKRASVSSEEQSISLTSFRKQTLDQWDINYHNVETGW